MNELEVDCGKNRLYMAYKGVFGIKELNGAGETN